MYVVGIVGRCLQILRHGKAGEARPTGLLARAYTYMQNLGLFGIIVDFTFWYKLEVISACSCIALFIRAGHDKDNGDTPIDDPPIILVLHEFVTLRILIIIFIGSRQLYEPSPAVKIIRFISKHQRVLIPSVFQLRATRWSRVLI